MGRQQNMMCPKRGRCVRVMGFHASHPSVRKLRSMGMEEGCDFLMERVSPFGDPCMIRMKGCRLALRRRDFQAMNLEIREDEVAHV